jgi:hypothetical protein
MAAWWGTPETIAVLLSSIFATATRTAAILATPNAFSIAASAAAKSDAAMRVTASTFMHAHACIVAAACVAASAAAFPAISASIIPTTIFLPPGSLRWRANRGIE